MRPTRPVRFLACLVALSLATARGSMRETLSVAKLLDGTVDTCVVRLDLPAPKPAHEVYGIALNFDGVLWLYVPGLGTRCLGAAAPGKDWPALLQSRLQPRAADGPDLKLYPNRVLIDRSEVSQTLTNGCFAGCLYQLSLLLAESDEPITSAGVLFFSGPTPAGPAPVVFDHIGHALLVFRTGGQWRLYDPAGSGETLVLPAARFSIGQGVDPRLLDYARAHGHPTQAVRFFPFSARSLRELAFRASKLPR